MNLFHGALSDSFGRRSVILASLGIYIVSALACVVAPSFGWLLALRVIQGLAAGAGMIVSRAMIRDLFHGVEAQQLMSQVAMLGGAGPVIAPIFGGWLHVWFGWRGPFVFLGLLGVTLLLACRYGLPESLPGICGIRFTRANCFAPIWKRSKIPPLFCPALRWPSAAAVFCCTWRPRRMSC
jgi:DHA1 family bicyclomycin/chloramphenicol resistance-like MFS transporter